MARILLIEDDPVLRTELSTLLRQANHLVREAENGLIALRTFGLEPAELVITDMMMPVMDGVETIEVLRKQFPEVKIVAMSEDGLVSAATCLRLAEQLGAHRTLMKPFPAQALLGTICELLEPA